MKPLFYVAIGVLGTLFFYNWNLTHPGFLDAPPMGESDFLITFSTADGEPGLRGIMRGFGDKDTNRRYLSYDAEGVPDWYWRSWSDCRKMTPTEQIDFVAAVDLGPGGRIEAICELDADGDVFVRGWIASVPKL